MSDNLLLDSKEYVSYSRGKKCPHERINGLDRVGGAHEEQDDDVGPSRKRVQGIALVQEHKCPPRGTNG